MAGPGMSWKQYKKLTKAQKIFYWVVIFGGGALVAWFWLAAL